MSSVPALLLSLLLMTTIGVVAAAAFLAWYAGVPVTIIWGSVALIGAGILLYLRRIGRRWVAREPLREVGLGVRDAVHFLSIWH